jgi:hypothetical protein
MAEPDVRYVIPDEVVGAARDLTKRKTVPGQLQVGMDASGLAQIQAHTSASEQAELKNLVRCLLDECKKLNTQLSLVTGVEL